MDGPCGTVVTLPTVSESLCSETFLWKKDAVRRDSRRPSRKLRFPSSLSLGSKQELFHLMYSNFMMGFNLCSNPFSCFFLIVIVGSYYYPYIAGAIIGLIVGLVSNFFINRSLHTKGISRKSVVIGILAWLISTLLIYVLFGIVPS